MRSLPWKAVVASGTIITVVGTVLGQAALSRAVVVAGFVFVIVHTLRRTSTLAQGPWRLIMAGGVVALLHALARLVHALLVDVRYPHPSPVEPLGYAAYLLMIAGAIQMVRVRTLERRREDTTDAAIVACVVAMLAANVLLAPYIQDGTVPVLDRLVVVGYVACIVALSGVVARISFGPGVRNAAYYLLAASASAIIANDLLLRSFIAGTEWALDASYVVAPFAFTFAAGAIAHPDVGALTARPRLADRPVGRQRLVLLAAAVLLGPALLVAAELGFERLDVLATICGSAVLALLVLLRMSDLVRSKEKATERERGLRSAATQLATAAGREAVLSAAVVGCLEITSEPGTARASLYAVHDDGFDLIQAIGQRHNRALPAVSHVALTRIGFDIEGPVQEHEDIEPIDVDGDKRVFSVLVPFGSERDGRFVCVVTQPTVFTREQVATFESFAAQVSLALESVGLRESMHIRRSNRRFRALVENSGDIVLVLDAQASIAFASPTVRRLLGRDERQVLHQPVIDLVYRPDQVHVRRVIAAPTRPGGTDSSVEVRFRHGSGELRWFELEARDLTAEDEVRGIVITARDISDRRRAEAQLYRSEARFRLMVQNSSDVVAIVDDDLLLTYVSPSVERMLGFVPADILGRNVFELLSITEAERIRAQDITSLTGRTVEVRIQGADGRVHAVEVAVTDMRDQPEVDGVVLNIRDVTERKTLEDDLRHQALHDDLTGLANRTLFAERVRQSMQGGNGQGDQLAVLFVDLDDFKLINDSLGHATGDQVLVAIADRIQQCLRLSDVAARFGGDEFAVLLRGVYAESEIIEVAERLRQSIGQPLRLAENEFRLTASIGIVINTTGLQTDEDLLRAADLAMYQAKQEGKDRFEIFESHMAESAFEELELKTALVRALENEEFVLHYQPIVDLATSRISGLEALLRWEDPSRGMVSPAAFIPTAEETGLIRPIGMWVAQQAARDLARWHDEGFDLYCSINVSGRQIGEDGFARKLIDRVLTAGADPTKVVVELTESVLADSGVAEVFEAFHEVGFRIALDDFGTGYSALQYLQSFHIDLIKIDRSFVKAMNTDSDAGVVQAVLDVARRIEANTIAEGIEDSAELRQLKQLGVQYGQGYYFSRPVPAEKVRELLEEQLVSDSH